MDNSTSRPRICPSCGHAHAWPAGDLVSGTCPLTGQSTAGTGDVPGEPDRAFSSARAEIFRKTHDEWLSLTASYVLDDRDRANYAAAWRRLAVLPGPGGPARWVPSEADLLDAALGEIERRRSESIKIEPPGGSAYGADAPLLWFFKKAPAGESLFVRARRCRRCGAPKCTRSTSAFIYCDYCAAYFDYDLGIASSTGRAVDPRYGWMSVMTGYSDEMKEARDAKDGSRYARLWREFYTYYTLLCYTACSPRIRDPEYRRALIDGYLVTIAVAKNLDPAYRAAARSGGEAEDAIERDSNGKVLPGSLERVLDAYDRLFDVEAGISERCGAFAAHPDGLDRELFVRVNHEELASRWLRELDPAEGRRFAGRLGLADDHTVPLPDGSVRRCGVCGSAVPVLAGARRVLCETCGMLLDTTQIHIRCPECGAPIALANGARAARCGHCNIEFEPV